MISSIFRRPGRVAWGSLALGLLVGGCASPVPDPGSPPLPSLPLLLGSNERVTELLDGTVIGHEIVAVGEGGTILRSGNSGQAWEKCEAVTNSTLTGVSFAPDRRHGWAVGDDAAILATTDAGRTWQQQRDGNQIGESLLDVHAIDERHVIAVGLDGLYLETADGGATWTRRQLFDRNSHLHRISQAGNGFLYLAGEHGTLARSADGGITWTGLAFPTDKNLYGVLPIGAHSLLAYGGDPAGRIFRSDDDGRSWTALTIGKLLLLKTGFVRQDGTILLAGSGFYLSRDGGLTFERRKLTPYEVNLLELLEAPDRTLVAFGPDGPVVLPAR